MLSMPPATAALAFPNRISCAADTIACAPEPQTRFTVMAGTVTGRPALNRRLAGGIHLGPGLNDIAHGRGLDLVGLEPGALDGGADGDGAEIRRRHVLQSPAEGADRRADGFSEDNRT